MSKLKLSGPASFIALVLSLPALRDTFIDHSLSIATMFVRVALALLLAMAGVAWVASVVDSFRLQNILRRNREEAGLASAGRRDADRDGAKR